MRSSSFREIVGLEAESHDSSGGNERVALRSFSAVEMSGTGRGRVRRALGWAFGLLAGLALGCSNNPYPPEDSSRKIIYSSFTDAPRTLDPATAYTTSSHVVTGSVYDTLLQYHFLKRPLELMPGLAVALPERTELEDGRIRYRFELRRDLLYANDVSFGLGEPGRSTREVVAADIAFQLMRIADPAVSSPVREPFSNLEGFQAFGERLSERREADASFAALPVHEQYRTIGGIDRKSVV